MSSLDLLREFISEVVIDATGSFANKRAGDFKKKVQDIAADMPNVFRRQEDQEKAINARLAAIEEIPNRLINQKRLRLSVSAAFSDAEWSPNAPVFDVIRLASTHDAYWADLKRFVQANAAAFHRAVEAVKQELSDIEREAEEMDWPAPWRRYTQWGSISHNVSGFAAKVKELTS